MLSEKELIILDKAIKLKHDDPIALKFGMMFSESYPHNEGYFSEWEEFFEEWEANEFKDVFDRPQYVWGTVVCKINLDAENILQWACDDLHEDAYDNLVDVDELQEFLNKWAEKQTGTETYYESSTYAIEIPWHLYKGE